MSGKIKTISITIEDVSFIFNDNLDEFYFITQNCFCVQCKKNYQSTIANYKIVLNNLFDIVLEGTCLECSHSMKRYIETGENPKTAANAESVWKTHKTLKELKIKKKKQ